MNGENVIMEQKEKNKNLNFKKNYVREFDKCESVREILERSARVYPNHISFVTKIKHEDKSIEYINHTYTDLLKDAIAFATGLFNLNLKDKRVAIIGKNRYEWILAHLSNQISGIVSVPLDKDLQLHELEDSLVRSKVDAIIFDEKHEENIKKIKENGITNLKEYICMSNIEGFKSFEEVLKNGYKSIEDGNTEVVNYKVDTEKMSMLLFTSGTTSKSKAVMLAQKGIVINVWNLLIAEDFNDTDTNIAFLPFHHIFGSTCILMMIYAGVKNTFPDGLRYIKQNLQEYQVSVFVGVPILVDKIMQNIEKEIEKQGKTKSVKTAIKISNFLLKFHIDIRRKLFKQIIDGLGGKMRFVVSGGAPLDGAIVKKFNDLGIFMVQGYGLTETSPVIAGENIYYHRPGSVGFAMNSVELKLENKDENGIGEVVVKGPNVMLGYYENEEATKKVLKDGWFHTGDLGYIDKDGFLFLTGRDKDVIVLKNGKKVFPEELETLINRLPEVEESFVYGMPENGDKNDLKVCLKIVYNEDIVKEKYDDISEEELHKILWEKVKEINKTFPQYKYIKSLIITKEPLIKTTTQKVKRKDELEKIINKH